MQPLEEYGSLVVMGMGEDCRSDLLQIGRICRLPKYLFVMLVIAHKLQHSTIILQVKDAWLQCNDRALHVPELVVVLQETARQWQSATTHLPKTQTPAVHLQAMEVETTTAGIAKLMPSEIA